MSERYTVQLSKIVKEFNLEVVFADKPLEEILVENRNLNRPGLQLAGFFDVFEKGRIQVLGMSEYEFLKTMPEEKQKENLEKLCALLPPAIIVARGNEVDSIVVEAAKKYGVSVLKSKENTSELVAALIAFLCLELAPRITRHGVLMEVYGEGILILGASGVGKSETAVELLVRGHRIISDDAVEIKRASARALVGSSPDNIRHFMELRGIGIVNARRIFGMSSVKVVEKIGLIIQLEQWNDNTQYDRMGTENNVMEILGIRVPVVTVPVKPGRNLAVIIEVAVMNQRLKKMGYYAANELMEGLGIPPELIEVPAETVIPNTYWEANK